MYGFPLSFELWNYCQKLLIKDLVLIRVKEDQIAPICKSVRNTSLKYKETIQVQLKYLESAGLHLSHFWPPARYPSWPPGSSPQWP